MKKGTVLNSDISSVISRLGHTDTLVVCDAGLPIPKSTTRIDMALTQGVPSIASRFSRPPNSFGIHSPSLRL